MLSTEEKITLWVLCLLFIAVLTAKINSEKVFVVDGLSETQMQVCGEITSRSKYLRCLDEVERWEAEQ